MGYDHNKLCQRQMMQNFNSRISLKLDVNPGPNVSTTPITAMGCRQCIPRSVVQLKGKHIRKPYCRNGVVDTFIVRALGPTWFHDMIDFTSF